MTMNTDPMSWRQAEGITAQNGFHDLKNQLARAVYARSEAAFSAGDAARDALRARAALQRRRNLARAALLESVGGLPPSDSPLRARVVGRLREDGFDIEKLIYEARPRVYVTANLYLPHGLKRPRGAVLFLCGHHRDAKHVEEYQIVCRHLVAAGLIVLAQDPIGQGERFSYHDPANGGTTVTWGVQEHDYVGAQCLLLGDGLARYFLHDAMRGIDLLRSRPEVDPRRIGVTGNSGGGTQTSLAMLADPRIAAAAPGTFIMNRRTFMYTGMAQDAEQVWPGLSARGIDHEDILLAVCPKPVCVLAVKYDFFPIEGTRATVDRCRRLWRLCGSEGNLELVEDRSDHCFTPCLARAAARFFARHLLGRTVEVDSAGIRPLPPEQLWCTPKGQVRGALPGARAVFEENQDRLRALAHKTRGLADNRRRKRAEAWLSDRLLGREAPVAPNLRCFPASARVENMVFDLGCWWSRPGILNEGLLFRPIGHAKPPVTVAVWDDGTRALARHSEWLRATCAAGRAALVLNVTGAADSEPHPLNALPPRATLGAIHKLNDDLIWLDDSLCALRAGDVARALGALDEWPGIDSRDLRVYAHGRAGVYAELAAAVEPRLARMEVREAMAGFAAWVRERHYDMENSRAFVLPGILKYADLSDLRRWRKQRKVAKYHWLGNK